MATKDNIIKLRVLLRLTQEQFAEAIGVSRSSVAQWEGGWSNPRMGNVQAIADRFHIPKSAIVEEGGMDGASITSTGEIEVLHATEGCESLINVPLYGSIAAGQPIDMDHIDDLCQIPSMLVKRYPGCFLLRVEGGSMSRTLPDGSLALVDPHDTEPDGHSAYAVIVNGYSATVKRIRKLANGLELIPDSIDPTYRSQIFDFNEDDTDDVTVLGRVVWMTAPLDYEI